MKKTLAEVLRKPIAAGVFWTHSRTIVDGCSPCSPGCARCWLRGMYARNLPGMPRAIDGVPILTPDGRFSGNVFERPDRLEGISPSSRGRRAPRVWTYWSDVFHPAVSAEFRNRLLAAVAASPGDFHIIITKRADVAEEFLGDLRPLPNAIIMITVEDQPRADYRIPFALRLDAKGWRVGVLAEPLLGPISFTLGDEEGWTNALTGEAGGVAEDMTGGFYCAETVRTGRRLSWIIGGGESGHGARICRPDWARSLRDQATAAGVPFLWKDNGAFKGPEDWTIAAGRELDGRTWDEVPALELGATVSAVTGCTCGDPTHHGGRL